MAVSGVSRRRAGLTPTLRRLGDYIGLALLAQRDSAQSSLGRKALRLYGRPEGSVPSLGIPERMAT